jgi:hypothetical protein
MPRVFPIEFNRERAHLVFELRERADVMHPALFIQRRDRLGPGNFAPRCTDESERHYGLYLP